MIYTEAYALMCEGRKVRHKYWPKYEYLCLVDGTVYWCDAEDDLFLSPFDERYASVYGEDKWEAVMP